MAIPNARKFQPGQSGNPTTSRPKPFADALRKALAEVDPKTKRAKLLLIASRLTDEALAGNVQAIKEIAERTDGKVPLPVAGDPETPLRVLIEVHDVSPTRA